MGVKGEARSTNNGMEQMRCYCYSGQMTDSPESRVDAAALGGGVVAVAMTMFAEPGAYDWLGATVSFALLLLLFAFLGSHERNGSESIAVGAVVGIVILPIFGLIAEQVPWFWSDFSDLNRWKAAGPANLLAEKPSTVSDEASCSAWLLITCVISLADQKWWQKRLKRREEPSS